MKHKLFHQLISYRLIYYYYEIRNYNVRSNSHIYSQMALH